MVELTQAVGVGLGLATSGLLAYAGYVTQRRKVSAVDRLALRCFAAWWYGAAFVILFPLVRLLLALGGILDPELHALISHAGNLPLAVALGGLAYYILYLITGDARWRWPVGVGYLAYFVYLVWYTVSLGERTVELGAWSARLVGGNGASPAATVVFGIVLAGPILALVAAYASLVFKVEERTQRYRLGMVVAGFALLFLSVILGFLLRWNAQPWFPLVYEVPALILAALVVLAYRPPSWIRQRLGVEPVDLRSMRSA